MRKFALCKRLGCMLAAAAAAMAMAGCSSTKGTPGPIHPDGAGISDDISMADSSYIDEIKDRGYLIAGCKMDVPGLSFYDEDAKSWSGLEIEIAYQTAANIFGTSINDAKEQNLVEFTGVTAADREEALENGKVDCLLATYSITEGRKQKFAFSDSYYTDYIGLMVKSYGKDANSLGRNGIRSIANLDGKYIGVQRNATTRDAFLRYIETMNSSKVSPIFCEYESYQALFKALKDGNIDVMAVDVSILSGYVDSSTVILNDRFAGQHYGAAVKKGHEALLAYINDAIHNE